jgi:hypothetical protein
LAFYLLLKRCFKRFDANLPYKSYTISQSERKGLSRIRPATLKRLEMCRAGPEPIDLPIIIIF